MDSMSRTDGRPMAESLNSRRGTFEKYKRGESITSPSQIEKIARFDQQMAFNPLLSHIDKHLNSYLSNYRMLTDAINIKKAYVVNIGVEFEVIPKPSENSATVVLRCVDELKRMLHNDRMQINGPLNISNMISQLDRLEGVQSIPSLEITNLYDTNNGYSGNVYDINAATKNNIVYPSLDPCIFEVKYPNADIKGRIVKP